MGLKSTFYFFKARNQHFLYFFSFHLQGRGRETATQRDLSSPGSLPKHPQQVWWAGLRPRAWDSVQACHTGGSRDPSTWATPCPSQGTHQQGAGLEPKHSYTGHQGILAAVPAACPRSWSLVQAGEERHAHCQLTMLHSVLNHVAPHGLRWHGCRLRGRSRKAHA